MAHGFASKAHAFASPLPPTPSNPPSCPPTRRLGPASVAVSVSVPGDRFAAGLAPIDMPAGNAFIQYRYTCKAYI